jgi:two-component system, cell cycle sensor histidine kinase and response regulator CckA
LTASTTAFYRVPVPQGPEDATPAREASAQAERLAALARLAGGVAHDLNNVLTAIVGYCDLARLHQARPEQWSADLAEAVAAAGRATDMTRRLAMFGRRHAGEPRPLELDAVLREMERRVRAVASGPVSAALGAPGAMITADPFYVREAVETLVGWGRLAGSRGVTLATSVEQVSAADAQDRADAHPGSHVCLAVTHHGLALDPAYAVQALEPFVRGRPQGDDGLKLASAYGLVLQAGGHATTGMSGDAMHFRFWWPRAARGGELDAVLPVAGAEAVVETRQRTVLVVEDEATVRSLLEELLQAAGFRVLSCGGGQEALALLEQPDFAPDVVITDVVMPDVTGHDVAHATRRLHPEAAVLLISGQDAPAASAFPFLRKPFSQAALVQTVAALVAGSLR